jgi:hypothetical protein
MLTAARRNLAAASPHVRLLLLLVFIALGTTHRASQSWNDDSRMATIQSLVESGTLVIDHSDYVGTGDKVFINGHFYSEKPPMPALIGAAVYFPLYQLGIQLHMGTNLAYYLITLLTVGVCWIVGALAFYDCLRFTGLDSERRLLATLALALGSLYFTWATTFNNHELAAAWLMIGFRFLLRARHGEGAAGRNLAAAGLFLSLPGTADIPTGIFYGVFLLYVLLDPALRRNVGLYLAPLLVTAVPALAMNYSIHHSIVPVQIVKAYFDYPHSPWHRSGMSLSGTEVNGVATATCYALQTLLGDKGFLLYNPFLLIALWGLWRELRHNGPFFREGVAIFTGSLGLMLYYWLMTTNFAGWSYSIRWFVPMLPLLLFFLFPFFQDFSKQRLAVFNAVLAVSAIISCVGALNPWSALSYSSAPFVANIEQFIAHVRDPFAFP